MFLLTLMQRYLTIENRRKQAFSTPSGYVQIQPPEMSQTKLQAPLKKASCTNKGYEKSQQRKQTALGSRMEKKKIPTRLNKKKKKKKIPQ